MRVTRPAFGCGDQQRFLTCRTKTDCDNNVRTNFLWLLSHPCYHKRVYLCSFRGLTREYGTDIFLIVVGIVVVVVFTVTVIVFGRHVQERVQQPQQGRKEIAPIDQSPLRIRNVVTKVKATERYINARSNTEQHIAAIFQNFGARQAHDG